MSNEIYNRKKRNSYERKYKPIIFISTEGSNKTEENYFRDFRRLGIKISFSKGNDTDPINITKNLLKTIEGTGFSKEDGDRAFALIDGDLRNDKNIQIKEADRIAKENGMDVILSNPCFEIWFLCHYLFPNKNFTSNEQVINMLKKYIRDYSKNKSNIFNETYRKIDIACKNAKNLEARLINDKTPHTTDFSPSTEVYKIINYIAAGDSN